MPFRLSVTDENVFSIRYLSVVECFHFWSRVYCQFFRSSRLVSISNSMSSGNDFKGSG